MVQIQSNGPVFKVAGTEGKVCVCFCRLPALRENTACCISNLRELIIDHHESKYAVLTYTLDSWGDVGRLNIFFVSESGHVAYQIKVKEV